MYDESENKEVEQEDITCPFCGLRQYGDVCAQCGIPIKEPEEKEKTPDDDDEYDRRERR
jgi:DNA-directed RNA polymerase subunit RPC12/RpoP